MCLLFVVQILNGYNVKAGEREKDVAAYYAVVDELNEKYNSEITMPPITEFVNSKLYQLNAEEFRKEIEEGFLQVNALNQGDIEIKSIESELVFYSSGQKTQWCYMNDSSNNKVGALYLTANAGNYTMYIPKIV